MDDDINEIFEYVQIYEGHTLMHETVDLYKAKLQNMKARPDDVLVAAFPKSGTTWTQEVVYLIANGLDEEKSKEKILEERFPCMDFKFPGVIDVDPDEWPKDQKRFIKTHLPYDMLPQDFKDKKCKIIYVMRNPKDVSVSYYYFLRMLNYNPFRDYTLHNIIQKFLFGLIPYGPYWEHNLGYWNEAKENPEHIMVVKFEDMIKRPSQEIRRIAKFMGQDFTDEQVEKIVHFTSFDQMKDNPHANYSWLDQAGIRDENESQFMRKGKIGDWKRHYTDELNKLADEQYERNFGGSGITHEFE